MNKSKMIKWLQSLKKDIGQSHHQDLWHYAEMLDEVIGIIEFSEDAISREEVCRAIITCGEVDNDLNHLYEIIENFPSVVLQVPNEDCISRKYLEEQLQLIEDITAMAHIDLGEDPYDETEEITMPISTVRKIFKKAPSVVPKANRGEWIEEFSDDGWKWVKDEL